MGAVALGLPKGSPRHVRIGRIYFWSMCGLNGSAFFLYRLFGTFGPFHVLAAISALTLAAGYLPLRSRRGMSASTMGANRVLTHGLFMSWSYVGLLAAAASEFAVRILDASVFQGVVLPSIAVTLLGGVLVHTRVPRSGWFRQKP